MLPESTRRLQFPPMSPEDVDTRWDIFSDPIAMQYSPRTRQEVRDWVERTPSHD